MGEVDISTLTFGQLLDESRNAVEKMNLTALQMIDARIDERLREVAEGILNNDTTKIPQNDATGGIICGEPRESDSDYCKNHTNLKTNKCFHIHDVDKWSGTIHFCGFCFKYLCPRCADTHACWTGMGKLCR